MLKIPQSLLLGACCLWVNTALHAAEQYETVIAVQEQRVLSFLRTFETFQEEVNLADMSPQRKVLVEALDNVIPELMAELNGVPVPSEWTSFDTQWKRSLGHLGNAYLLILRAPPDQFLGAFLHTRREFTEACYRLYALRTRVPKLQEYWLLSNEIAELTAPAALTTGDEIRTGFVHHKPTASRASYSTYVPEKYDPKRAWPLVLALHGSVGSGAEYLLTWLRPAKSHGYIVLSPKSLERTWSIEQPALDIRSILVMLTELTRAYNIDTNRLFVSGLSDGGTFSYALGLHCPHLFAGIAPIASALPPQYPLGRAKNLPVLLVHGKQDSIFPVASARAAHARFQDHQFKDVSYIELSDWGHAYTYSINESHVIPWFNTHSKLSPMATTKSHTDKFSCSELD